MKRNKPYALFYTTCMFTCMLIVFSACSSESNHNESLDNAQISIENNDYRTARSICDEVYVSESKSESKDAELMARLSVLYMKLADHNEMTDKEDNLDYAYECYEQAFDIDSTKAKNYYLSLGVEDMPQVALLESIVRNSKVHPDSVGHDFIDSIDLGEVDILED